MRGRLWTEAEKDEIRRRRVAGEAWHVIGASYKTSGDAVRGVASRGGFRVTTVGREDDRGVRIAPSAHTVDEKAKVDQAPPLVKVPFVQTSRTRAESYLIVPDLQMPFHAPDALEFCERVRREFAIPRENVLFVGDEVDNFHGKGFDKKPDPNAEHTPKQELRAAVEELKRWYACYPTARLAVSNHGTRYERRAAEAEISSQWMRLYRDVIDAPAGWQWQDSWLIQASKHPFILEHGHEGKTSTEAKVLENGYSTVHGHFTKAQYVRVTNRHGRQLWGFCAAALIDFDTYAFKYAKKYPRRPDNGCGVILDGGRIPIHVPYES